MATYRQEQLAEWHRKEEAAQRAEFARKGSQEEPAHDSWTQWHNHQRELERQENLRRSK